MNIREKFPKKMKIFTPYKVAYARAEVKMRAKAWAEVAILLTDRDGLAEVLRKDSLWDRLPCLPKSRS